MIVALKLEVDTFVALGNRCHEMPHDHYTDIWHVWHAPSSRSLHEAPDTKSCCNAAKHSCQNFENHRLPINLTVHFGCLFIFLFVDGSLQLVRVCIVCGCIWLVCARTEPAAAVSVVEIQAAGKQPARHFGHKWQPLSKEGMPWIVIAS